MLVPREKGDNMSYNTETSHKCSHPECKVCNPRPTRRTEKSTVEVFECSGCGNLTPFKKENEVETESGPVYICDDCKESQEEAERSRPPFDGEAWVAGVLRSIWQYQGEDILQCSGIDYNSGKSIPRSEVIECVLDAGNPRTFGEREAKKDPEKLFALNAFLKLSYEQKIKFCKKRVFPCKRYGW
jgi:hypothetical protein